MLRAWLDASRGETLDGRFAVLARRWGVSKRKVYSLYREMLNHAPVAEIDVAQLDDSHVECEVREEWWLFWEMFKQLREMLPVREVAKACVCDLASTRRIFALCSDHMCGTVAERRVAREHLQLGLRHIDFPSKDQSQFANSKLKFSDELVVGLARKFGQLYFEHKLSEAAEHAVPNWFVSLLIRADVASDFNREIDLLAKSLKVK